MARTIDAIFTEMYNEGVRLATEQENTDALNMFNNTSAFALWRLFYYAMAFCVWSFENVQDLFFTNVNNTIANEFAHTPRWYRTKALAFQYGFNLIPDTDKFDNTGKTQDEIDASFIVKYAAVNETTVDGKRVLLIKIATLVDGVLSPLSDVQLAAFTAYMQEIKDAGVPLIIYNRLADLITAEVDFYYNPLLLDSEGNRLDGLAGKPAEDAANNFLLNLPFNGEFSNAKFIDALQDAYGAAERDVFLLSASRKSGNNDYVSIPNTFIPDAGYARFDVNGLTINYIPYVAS